MDIEMLQEYFNLGSALIAAIAAAIPTVIGIWNNFKKSKSLEETVQAVDDMQIAIGKGGTVNDVVCRISDLNNQIIEDRLSRNGATVIDVEAEEVLS